MKTKFLLFVFALALVACSGTEDKSYESNPSLFVRASASSQELGMTGYKVTEVGGQLALRITGPDTNLNDQLLKVEQNDENGLVLSLITGDDQYYRVDLDRSTQHVILTHNNQELIVDKDMDLTARLDKLTQSRFAAMSFLMRDYEAGGSIDEIQVEGAANSASYFCKMTFMQVGGRNYTTAAIENEASNYANNHGCEGSMIGAGVDCSCVFGDLLCFCMATYNMVGVECSCNFSIDL